MDHQEKVLPLGNKVQPFWLPTDKELSEREAVSLLSTAVRPINLPGGGSQVLKLKGAFKVAPLHHKGRDGVMVSPITEGLEAVTIEWCQALAAIPPKSLPRGQRPMVSILGRLTPEPTGNVAIDKGRQMMLDRVLSATLWGPITKEIERVFSGKE